MFDQVPIIPAFFLLCCLCVASVFAGDSDNVEYLIDPTRPLFQSQTGQQVVNTNVEKREQAYQLSSILIRENSRLAVINARQVQVGDQVSGAEVISIENDRVTLDINGQEKVIELYGQSIKFLSEGEG